VVQAYGNTTQRYSTGSIGVVRAKDIEKKPVTNVLLALQGEVPRVVVEQSTGMPNSGFTVRMRCLNSLDNGSDPLYILLMEYLIHTEGTWRVLLISLYVRRQYSQWLRR
jgi:TonB-dependent starch-binding outer membrane protein SusC